MSFEIGPARPLSKEKIEIVREAQALLRRGYDRRELMRHLGLCGTFFLLPMIGSQPAHAFVPAALVALRVIGGVVSRGSLIAASMSLSNASAAPVRGLVGVRHIEPSGNVAGTDSTPVTIPANSERDITHRGFKAGVEGDNEYHAESDVNEMEDTFQVTA